MYGAPAGPTATTDASVRSSSEPLSRYFSVPFSRLSLVHALVGLLNAVITNFNITSLSLTTSLSLLLSVITSLSLLLCRYFSVITSLSLLLCRCFSGSLSCHYLTPERRGGGTGPDPEQPRTARRTHPDERRGEVDRI